MKIIFRFPVWLEIIIDSLDIDLLSPTEWFSLRAFLVFWTSGHVIWIPMHVRTNALVQALIELIKRGYKCSHYSPCLITGHYGCVPIFLMHHFLSVSTKVSSQLSLMINRLMLTLRSKERAGFDLDGIWMIKSMRAILSDFQGHQSVWKC